MPPIRNSAKAIIIQTEQLLTIKNRDLQGHFYILPGGGQDHCETLHEALHRECKEELGVDIVIGRLRFIREYIGAHHEFAEHDGDVHQIEFMFHCNLAEGHIPANGTLLDTYQIGISWLPLTQLDQYRLYPSVLKELLKIKSNDEIDTHSRIYLGDIN
jgi:8-oxo-dGTP pyrophosphatase MutT (NUDIX family)